LEAPAIRSYERPDRRRSRARLGPAADRRRRFGAEAGLFREGPIRKRLNWRTNKGRTALTTWADLGALPDIADALARVGITAPFPIQEMAIPIALTGADVIGQARTGTGKTLAFGVPLLQRIITPRD